MSQRTLKVIHIEDEKDARTTLNKMIEKFIKNVEIIGTATNLEEGMELVSKNEFDLLFLDLQLPDGNGFYILENFKEINSKTILTTADDSKGIEALKLGVSDYLVKPYSISELQDSINKQRTIIDIENSIKQTNKKILLPDINGTRVLDKKQIIRFEADGNYTKVYIKGEADIVLISKTLKYFENQLGEDYFIRVHNSHIINIDFISRINKKEGGSVKLSNGDIIKTSLKGRKLLRKILNV